MMATNPRAASGGEDPEGGARRTGRAAGPDGARVDDRLEPCLRCGVLLPLRLYGCKGGKCPNCGHAYPHGDCSD